MVKWHREKKSCTDCEYFNFFTGGCELGIANDYQILSDLNIIGWPLDRKGCRAARQNAELEKIRARQLSNKHANYIYRSGE